MFIGLFMHIAAIHGASALNSMYESNALTVEPGLTQMLALSCSGS